ncbi:hypothetical protein C2869_07350 [Saccharobesus litoralis]|uniref:Uncharacterized protein n=1 Tax=Saccharobesus litoralis TaxID=2172099 RepID=A0A2S0VPW2_9ALTE|nr:hypothetical protein [Saccharobesus litoralis]AWB66257.1 hypothetical protein C2869_07350 [Saccharobesus litoralis]
MSDTINKLNEIINKSAWLVEDKEWIKNRKTKWRDLSRALKQDKKMSSKELAFYKSYYITGFLDAQVYESRCPDLYTLYLMMFHADQNESSLTNLYLQLVGYLCDERSLIGEFCRIQPSVSLGHSEKGYFDGKESVYCKLLYGETASDFSSTMEANSSLFFVGFCQESIELLLSENSYIHSIYFYLVDFSFYTAINTEFERAPNHVYISQFLQLIVAYEQLDPFKDSDLERHTSAWRLVKAVREKLQQSNLPDKLREMWEFTQTEKGKTQRFEYFQDRYPILKQLADSA